MKHYGAIGGLNGMRYREPYGANKNLLCGPNIHCVFIHSPFSQCVDIKIGIVFALEHI